jgi:hypothetical protein
VRLFFLIAAAIMLQPALAQDEDPADFEIVLPDAAQKCVLPASPDAIPENATLDQLKVAKQDVADFQARAIEFRDCLDAANEDPDITPGNKQAIVQSYNYSVEMEERVAQRFNEAVRDYKQRQAAQ